ncbi:MAG: hypothetical protein ABIH67_01185 [Candidatus Uhrbacteria bacterium]
MENETTTNDVLDFLHEHMMTKEDGDKIITKVIDIDGRLDDFVTKEDLKQTESRITSDFDRFVKLHETLDLELVALRSKYERLEERIVNLEAQRA